MSIEEIILEVQKETEAYLAKIQALQDKMPSGFYFQVPEIAAHHPLGYKPLFVLRGIDIVKEAP